MVGPPHSPSYGDGGIPELLKGKAMKRMMMAAALLLAGAAQAQTMTAAPAAPAAPMSAMPPGYLAGKPPVEILKLLPPPPKPGSAADYADREIYTLTANTIGDPIWERAKSQLNPTSPEFVKQLSCALGTQISPQGTPFTFQMFARAGIDLSGPMTVAKEFYKRPRPFTTDKGKACDPISDDGVGARLGWSYPSGHSGIGWLWALILSDAAPAHAEALRSFGVATGDLRIACRVHWLSDVAAGRVLGTAVYQRIAETPDYRADVERARDELAKAPPLKCSN